MELAEKILSSLFPSRCILCLKTVDHNGRSSQPDSQLNQLNSIPARLSSRVEICTACEAELPRNTCYCQRCALPLPDDLAGGDQVITCGRCIKKPPAFDYAYSLFRYEAQSIKLVHQLKFGGKISYARSIGEMLLAMLQQTLLQQITQATDSRPDCLLPVPLHKSRMRQRGFNQSIEISRVIAKRLKLPIEYKAVIRKKPTAAQTGLDAKQRQKNIKGAFELSGKIKHKHILIVDDVITTGATVNELARLLKKNGVEQVGVLSIARALLKN